MEGMTQVWAHRGASADAPENTLPAFELAAEQGADGVELDVQLTRDGEVVVMHDETLDRTTDGSGWVADQSLDELRRLDASAGRPGFAGTRVPTLAEVLTLARGAGLVVNVELKNNEVAYVGLEERVLDEVAAAGMARRVVLSSFNHQSLRLLARLAPDVPRGALYSDPLFQPWEYAVRLGVRALHPPLRVVRSRLVERCRGRALAVHAWTVDDVGDLRRVVALGVDAVITNHPARARRVVDAAG